MARKATWERLDDTSLRVTTGPTNEDLCRSCVAGYSDNEIDTVFDGDHDAYWKYQLNILQDYE